MLKPSIFEIAADDALISNITLLNIGTYNISDDGGILGLYNNPGIMQVSQGISGIMWS